MLVNLHSIDPLLIVKNSTRFFYAFIGLLKAFLSIIMAFSNLFNLIFSSLIYLEILAYKALQKDHYLKHTNLRCFALFLERKYLKFCLCLT